MSVTTIESTSELISTSQLQKCYSSSRRRWSNIWYLIFHFKFLMPTYGTYAGIIQVEMSQVCKTFKSLSEDLLLETMNRLD